MATRNTALLGERDGLAWSTRGALTPSVAKKALRHPNQVRAASNANRIPTGLRQFSGTQLALIGRFAHVIGAGDRADLRASFLNFITDPSGVVLNTNGYIVDAMSFELDGASYSVPVFFNGLRSVTVPAGAAEVKCDPVSAWCFGRPRLRVGTKVWCRVLVRVTTDGHFIPSGVGYEGAGGGSFGDGWLGWVFTPGTGTQGSVDGVGPISFGGPGNGANVPHCIVTGRFADGDPATQGGFGTSIMQNVGDTLEGYGYSGFFQRALVNATFNGGWGAGINFGSSGAGTGFLLEGGNLDRLWPYVKYCRDAVEEFGTNDLFYGTPLATLQTNVQAVWSLLRTKGIKRITRTGILPRTDSTDNWTTRTGQTPVSAAFGPGGAMPLFNTWAAGLVGSQIQAFVPMDSVRDPVTPTVWRTTGVANATVDFIGTHPVDVTHADMGNELRPALAALP